MGHSTIQIKKTACLFFFVFFCKCIPWMNISHNHLISEIVLWNFVYLITTNYCHFQILLFLSDVICEVIAGNILGTRNLRYCWISVISAKLTFQSIFQILEIAKNSTLVNEDDVRNMQFFSRIMHRIINILEITNKHSHMFFVIWEYISSFPFFNHQCYSKTSDFFITCSP